MAVNDAWRDAKLVAGREPGRTPAAGAGTSMQPVYGDNTMLVISPIDYDQLRPGMTVAYMNQRGVRVVHRLVQKLADGWQVIGLNNDRVDDDVVTRKNLIGVIYASFNTMDESPPK
ncbi:MAG TPA: S24/S26 family peptidase [Opitutaceae bacterium]|nr:S24/S26 family peptidase [Opitutaceae bacterium]